MDITQHRPNAGWIEVITGSMFSGKSEELIRRLRRAQIAKRKVQIFKPKIDNRFGEDHIISHSDMRMRRSSVVVPDLLSPVLPTPKSSARRRAVLRRGIAGRLHAHRRQGGSA